MNAVDPRPPRWWAALLFTAVAGCGSTGPDPAKDILTAKIDGVDWAATTLAATYTGGVLAVTGSDGNGQSLLFGIGPVSAPGTFSVGANLPSNAQLLVPAGGGAGRVWIAAQHLGLGSFTVTSLSASGAAGTFQLSLSAVTTSGATGTKTLTEGKFDVRF